MWKQNQTPSGRRQPYGNMFYNEPESFKAAMDELLELTFAQHQNRNNSLASSSTQNSTGSQLQQASTAAQALNIESRDYVHPSDTFELIKGHRQSPVEAKTMASNQSFSLNPDDFPSLESGLSPAYKPVAVDGPYPSAINHAIPTTTCCRAVQAPSIISHHPVPGDFLAAFGPFDSELRSNVPNHHSAITPGVSAIRPTRKASSSGFRSWAQAPQPITAPQTSRSSIASWCPQANASQANTLEPLRQPRGPPTSNERGFDFSLRSLPDIRFRNHRATPSSSSLASLSYTDSSTPSTLNSSLWHTELCNSTNNPISALASSQSTQSQEKKVFIPSHMRLEKNGLVPPRNTDIEGCPYKGDPNSTAFLMAVPYLGNEFNCSLFITNIPVGTSGSDMFDRIRAGAVDALHFSAKSEEHPTIAAKLVFTNPEGAARLHSHAQWPGVRIGDNRLHIVYNRDGVLSRDGIQTRILLIEGPEDMMTCEHWMAYFDEACVYELDRWLYRACSSLGRKRMEFRFYRADGQAVTCYQRVRWDEELDGIVQIKFGLDVCANNTSGAWIEYPQ